MTRQAAADREADALDAAISDALWTAQLDPAGTPRIIRQPLVNVDYSYFLPGPLWPDGRSRVFVNPRTVIDIPGLLRQLAAKDSPDPGAEPPALAGGVG